MESKKLFVRLFRTVEFSDFSRSQILTNIKVIADLLQEFTILSFLNEFWKWPIV